MELGEILYYVRQYRLYNMGGRVPDVTCDECNTPYHHKVIEDDIWLWCLVCDIEVDPGWGVIMEMVRRVKRIEATY